MARQYPEIKFVAVHPGVVNTGLFDDFRKRRPYVGAVLWASTAPTHDVRSGGFYNPSLKEYRHGLLANEKLAQELEEWTEAEFRGKGF
ncbi:hypothetical protein NU219Hw_g8005t1 [Hortaea werneckii]